MPRLFRITALTLVLAAAGCSSSSSPPPPAGGTPASGTKAVKGDAAPAPKAPPP